MLYAGIHVMIYRNSIEGRYRFMEQDMQKHPNFDYYMALMDDVYRFVLCSMDNYSAVHDYGTGKVLNMVEMHTLSMIAEQPGLRVTDVAKLWNRTLGAASKNISKLCSKGLIEKKKLPGNDKTIHLYPTERGKEIARLHRQYDRRQIADTLRFFLSLHTEEELRTFHRVICSGIQYTLEHTKDGSAGLDLPEQKS